MRRLKIVVEGQTEETFVRNVLANYLYNRNSDIVEVTPILVLHSVKDGVRYKGGIRRINGYKHIVNYLSELIKSDKSAIYSTMFDLYAFPQDIGSYSEAMAKSDPYEKVEMLENRFYMDVFSQTEFLGFIPYIQLHEFEALLFSNPEAYLGYLVDGRQLNLLLDIKNSKQTPEYINDGPTTAPSKRMIQIISGYEKLKAIEGPNLAELIGIDVMRQSCQHFDTWIKKLENS